MHTTEVLDFIKKFTCYEKDLVLYNTFTNGYCYYFAVILQERFGGEILYNPIEGHFVTCIVDEDFCPRLYDITGDVTSKHNFDTLQQKTYWMRNGRVIRDVILKDGRCYEV